MQTEHIGKETLWVETDIGDRRNKKYVYIGKMYVSLDSPKSIKMLSFEISRRNIELSVKSDIDFSGRWISGTDTVEQ